MRYLEITMIQLIVLGNYVSVEHEMAHVQFAGLCATAAQFVLCIYWYKYSFQTVLWTLYLIAHIILGYFWLKYYKSDYHAKKFKKVNAYILLMMILEMFCICDDDVDYSIKKMNREIQELRDSMEEFHKAERSDETESKINAGYEKALYQMTANIQQKLDKYDPEKSKKKTKTTQYAKKKTKTTQ